MSTAKTGSKRLPKPYIFLIIFAILSISLGFAVIELSLPEAVIFLMAVPILWAIPHYSLKVVTAMFVLLAAITAAAIYLFSYNWLTSLASLSPVFILSLFAMIMAAVLVKKHRAYETASNQLFRMAASYSFSFDIWQKPDGNFGYISPACEHLTGYPPSEFIANPQHFFDIIHAEDRNRVMYLCTKTRRRNEEIKTTQYRLTRADGGLRWMEHTCQQVYSEDGEYLGKRSSNIDITDRKKIEQALKLEAERLTLALEGTEEGVWDVNLLTGQTYINPHYALQLGFEPGRSEIKLQELYQLIHPEDLPGVVKAFKTYIRGEIGSYQVEYRLHLPEGKWRWVLDRGKIVGNIPAGKPTRMIGTYVDITRLKETEEALQQSEMKVRQLTENMREVFWLRDRTTRNFIYVSSAFNDIWGRPVSSLAESPNLFMEGIHWEDLGRVYHAQKELAENERPLDMEFRVIRPGGEIRWVWCREFPIRDNTGRFYRVAGVAEDITERKVADNSLKDSEKRYRDLIENQGGGVSIVDPNDRIVYINPAGEDIFGILRGTMLGRNMKEFLDEDQARVLQAQSALRRQGVESSFELTIKRPDEENRHLLVTATPRFDVNNQYLGAIAIFKDISQRKQSEERLLYISLHDSLTDLYNRAFFDDELIKLDQGEVFPVSVIMIDVDGLKAVNDGMGHAMGDQLLIAAARVLKVSIRSEDVLARLGGDEFAILMPSTDEKALKQVLNRINENIEMENRSTINPFNLSLSAGGVVSHDKGQLQESVKEADARMYEIKQEKKKQYYINVPITPK
jgi:diguanylate cyclase (GGDEF)-like protein/PAS domain S-box-containing protein